MPSFCVIQLARFGDLLQTKRLLLSLQRIGEVHLLCDRNLQSLAERIYPQINCHFLDLQKPPSLLSLRTLLAELQACNFSHIFNLNFSPLNFALTAAFEPQIVHGYCRKNAQPLKSVWAEQAFRLVRNRGNHSLNLVDIWAGYCTEPVDPTEVNPEAKGGKKGIGLVLAGQNARRSLPPTLLVRLAQAALQRIGHGPIYLLGTPNQQKNAREFLTLAPNDLSKNCIDLTGKTDIPTLCDTLEGLDLLLSPDTGTIHLAAHLGVPVAGFFLSSALCQETGPYGLGHMIFQATPPCAPCIEAQPCTQEMLCLRGLMNPFVTQYLAGQSDKLPKNVQVFKSDFDKFGVRYNPLGEQNLPQDKKIMETDRAELYFLQSGESEYLAPSPYLWPERNWLLPRHEQERMRSILSPNRKN